MSSRNYTCELCMCSLCYKDVIPHVKGKLHINALNSLKDVYTKLGFININGKQHIAYSTIEEANERKNNTNTENNLEQLCQSGEHISRVEELTTTSNVKSLPVIGNEIRMNRVAERKVDTNAIELENEVVAFTKDDDDFLIPRDVEKEILKLIHISPFRPNPSKECKDKEQQSKLIKRLNKVYSAKHLKIEEEMYAIDEKKISNIKLGLKALVPFTKDKFYCLVCDIYLLRDFDLVYEHICIKSHEMKINEIKKDTNHQLLLSKCITKISGNKVKCNICKTMILNDVASINSHVKHYGHKKQYRKCNTIRDCTFNTILKDVNSLWYSIQNFSCVLCNKNFKYKIEFIEHIINNHDDVSNNKIYNFCIPCATLWLDTSDCYTEHSNDIIHTYLIRSKDFRVEDLSEYTIKLLKNVDEVSNNLLQQVESLNDNVPNEIAESLEKSLKSFWPRIKAYLFGSRVTGLGFSNSDIDIYLDCRNAYCQDVNKDIQQKQLAYIEETLREQEDQWKVKKVIKSRTPVLKLLYNRTGVRCDISVSNGLSVENSKLIKSYNEAYPPCRKLILFIKIWLSNFDLPRSHGFTSYAIVWLVIFYLQLKSLVPSVATLIKEENQSRLVCGWETGVAKPKSCGIPVKSISSLLADFFNFYSQFDYRYDVVCPLMGNILKKKDFIEFDTLPDEMKPYIDRMNNSNDPEYLRIDSPLCVQDPFDLSHNLTKGVSSITLKHFKEYCERSAFIVQTFNK